MEWDKKKHSAYQTDNYLFNQLIPYIGNKRKLLNIIQLGLKETFGNPANGLFIDFFSGSSVVSRLAKKMGYRVFANDWEPYSKIFNLAFIQTSSPPIYFNKKNYLEVVDYLNKLPPIENWVTTHLCPDDDENYDLTKDRLFYMRKNGLRIDTIREQIANWEKENLLNPSQIACILAPLLYCACYHANTSGVFKGFHKGWGGQTKTALYRITGDLILHPIQFFNNYQKNEIFQMDAQLLAEWLHTINLPEYSIAYLDPPYNQHPYGSNYHVLNSIALWDKPYVSPYITKKEKSAIRKDWRDNRKSSYTIRRKASSAYNKLLNTLPTQWIMTSYSTDGFIPLDEMIHQNCMIGNVSIFAKSYKRYRVSSQRYSDKANNVEFVLLTQKGKKTQQSASELTKKIFDLEKNVHLTHLIQKTKNIYIFKS